MPVIGKPLRLGRFLEGDGRGGRPRRRCHAVPTEYHSSVGCDATPYRRVPLFRRMRTGHAGVQRARVARDVPTRYFMATTFGCGATSSRGDSDCDHGLSAPEPEPVVPERRVVAVAVGRTQIVMWHCWPTPREPRGTPVGVSHALRPKGHLCRCRDTSPRPTPGRPDHVLRPVWTHTQWFAPDRAVLELMHRDR